MRLIDFITGITLFSLLLGATAAMYGQSSDAYLAAISKISAVSDANILLNTFYEKCANADGRTITKDEFFAQLKNIIILDVQRKQNLKNKAYYCLSFSFRDKDLLAFSGGGE